MFCQKCGSQLNDGSKFCTTCGAPVENQPVIEPFAPVGQEPVYQDYSVTPEAPAYAPYGDPTADAFVYAPDASNTPAPAKKKSKAKKIIIPIVAVVVAAAVALGVYFGFFANQKYYISTMTIYSYDEDGEVVSTQKMAFYGKFMLPLELTAETDDSKISQQFVLDKKDRIIEYKVEEDGEGYSIDIEYEKEDGKQIGTGSCEDDNDVKHEIEIAYESKNEFTITIDNDGETSVEFNCYINDEGYSVTEWIYPTSKRIFVYDGANIIEQKEYERDDEDDNFELTYSTENTYNKAGYLTESVSKNSYDNTTYKTVYERNKKNVPISIECYEDGEKVKYTKIDEENDDSIVLEVFDEDDETVKYIEYGFKGKKITYEKGYDEDKNLTSETTYNKNGLPEEIVYYNSDGEIYAKTVYEYEKR